MSLSLLLQGAASSLALFIEGLTLVCIIGTAILWVIFGFLFVAERQMAAHKQPGGSGDKGGKTA